MNKENLKTILLDQQELINEKLKTENIIKREGLTECRRYLAYPNILLISGLRRAGKSFFSHLLVDKEKYAYINFDDERLIGTNASDLNSILECFYELHGDFNFLLLDEIQNISGWELFVNRLRSKYKIIITGSNASLLSSELASHLTGRFISFNLSPLSFREFLAFNSLKGSKNFSYSTKMKGKIISLFSRYLKEGGIFEYYKFGKEFLRGLFSSIITKDIVGRYKPKYPSAVEELASLTINYFTSKLSLSNLTKSLKIKSSHTTKEYLKYLENTFMVFTLSKFSYKLKEQFTTFKKVYIMDNGIINSLTTDLSENRGRLLENLVAIELKRRSWHEGFSIYYWDNYNVECDFIKKEGQKITGAYQVCLELNLNNREREITGLITALKEFGLKEGTIFTESMEDEIKIEGHKIKILPVWKWLLTNS